MMKTASVALVWALALGGLAAGDTEEAPVRIYLPRSVKVDAQKIQLADVGVVLCDDAAVEAKARRLALGRAPWPKETIVVDRKTILSCLAGCDIKADRVRFAGAGQVTVLRDERTISPAKLLALAEEFLQKSSGDTAGCVHEVVREPQELTVSGSRDLDYSCTLGPKAAAGRIVVRVAVSRKGKQLGFREVLYKRMYLVRSAVAAKAIPAGAALSTENVEIQTSYHPQPAPPGWKPPYGLLARRSLSAGTVIRPSMTAEKAPDLLIRRNQVVALRVQGVGFVIKGLGQALESGRPGEYIKVRNVDSRRVITGRIAFDGVVEPVYKR